MDEQIQWAPSGFTISEVTNQFFIVNFNDKRTYYKNFLYITKMVWRELFWDTIFAINRTDLKIEKDSTGYFIRKPQGMARLLSVLVKDDCGIFQPLLISNSVGLEFVPAPSIGDCKCGGSELCNIVKSNITVREEEFNGVTYKLKTYFDTLASGEIYEVTEFPVYDTESGEVVIDKKRVLSCTLDVSVCGCPKPTEENKVKIIQNCGCLPFFSNCDLPAMTNKHGYYNYDIRGGKIYLSSDSSKFPLPDIAKLVWQPNLQDKMAISEDCIVPEYALKTMFTGISFYSIRWRKGSQFGPNERVAGLGEWETEKLQLAMFMYPFDPVMFRAAQGIIPKWG